MTSQQRDTGNISSSDSLPEVAEPVNSPPQVKRPRPNNMNEDPAAVVDAMSPKDQQAVLHDPTVHGGDVVTDKAAENEPEDLQQFKQTFLGGVFPKDTISYVCVHSFVRAILVPWRASGCALHCTWLRLKDVEY